MRKVIQFSGPEQHDQRRGLEIKLTFEELTQATDHTYTNAAKQLKAIRPQWLR